MGFCNKPNGLIFINAVNFRRGLTCTLWLSNALTETVANRGLKPVYVKVKPNHFAFKNLAQRLFEESLGSLFEKKIAIGNFKLPFASTLKRV